MLLNNQTKRIFSFGCYLSIVAVLVGCTSSVNREHRRLIDEMEYTLRAELLDVWYPASIDSVYGGFLSDLDYAWQPDGPQKKMIVTQTRHVWTAAQAAMFYNEDRFREIAEHGYNFISKSMWDRTYGGFYMLCDRQGNPIQGLALAVKSAYGNAFAIYALATYYRMCGDTAALQLARSTFQWLEQHSYDPQYGGYFDQLNRDGSRVEDFTWKDQNSSIHLLEAFMELYQVWPDSLLRRRLAELLVLIRDTITTEKGYLTLYLEPDWTPVSFRDSSATVRKANQFFDHVSFGHDIETAYLMLEAAHILGLGTDPQTLTVAKKMVDHALANGWDVEKGGFYYEGYYFNETDTITIIDPRKEWWVQAEGMNALLLMANLFPEKKKYYTAFRKQWKYIQAYLIDHEHGGWYRQGLDMNPDQIKAPKGSIWKINYHITRTLINCIKMLKSEHELTLMIKICR